jgi:hypothetical protein
MTPEEISALQADAKRLQEERDAALALLAQRNRDSAHAANVAFGERLVAEARIPTELAPVIVKALDTLEQLPDEDALFGEGDQAKPLHAVLKDRLAQMPPMVAFGEQLGGPVPAYRRGMSDAELDAAARALAAREGISYAAALARV